MVHFLKKMVGFILNSCCIYRDKKAVFDVGTAVFPLHRGKKVFTRLFAFGQQELINRKVEVYYLEVLQQNKKAIQAYQKQGFEVVREFSVLKASNVKSKNIFATVKCCDLEQFAFETANQCTRVQPSYEHSDNILKLSPNQCTVAYTTKENQTTAFCVFSKHNGNIMQMGYEDITELKEVLQWILSQFCNITAKNIDKRYTQVLELLYSLGFSDVTEQFEMMKKLSV